jgi:adenine/guanine phosphoribosyltransferase-like PRPP-binding protein
MRAEDAVTASTYFDAAFGSRRTLVARAKRALADVEFDTMVGTGLSGALVIPTLAKALDVDFLLVRKDSDESHSSGEPAGTLGHQWIFVDDFVSTGATLAHVRSEVEEFAETNDMDPHFDTTYMGAYLYQTYRGRGPGFWRPGHEFPRL